MGMTADKFMTTLVERLSLEVHQGRTVMVEPSASLGPRGRGTATLFVTFVNLPESRVKERRGSGAESENNRMLFSVRGFNDVPYENEPAERVTVEQLVCSVGYPGAGPKRMRKKTSDPDKIASYLTSYINEVASSHAPRFTHK